AGRDPLGRSRPDSRARSARVGLDARFARAAPVLVGSATGGRLRTAEPQGAPRVDLFWRPRLGRNPRRLARLPNRPDPERAGRLLAAEPFLRGADDLLRRRPGARPRPDSLLRGLRSGRGSKRRLPRRWSQRSPDLPLALRVPVDPARRPSTRRLRDASRA